MGYPNSERASIRAGTSLLQSNQPARRPAGLPLPTLIADGVADGPRPLLARGTRRPRRQRTKSALVIVPGRAPLPADPIVHDVTRRAGPGRKQRSNMLVCCRPQTLLQLFHHLLLWQSVVDKAAVLRDQASTSMHLNRPHALVAEGPDHDSASSARKLGAHKRRTPAGRAGLSECRPPVLLPGLPRPLLHA